MRRERWFYDRLALLGPSAVKTSQRSPGAFAEHASACQRVEQRFAVEAERLTFDTYLHAVRPLRGAIETLERRSGNGGARSARPRLAGSAGGRRTHATAPAWPGGRDRRLRPLPHRRGADGLRRAVPCEHSSRERAGRGRSPRSETATCAGCWSRLPGTPAADRGSATSSPAATAPGRPRRRACLALPATPQPTLATDGCSRQARSEDRRCLRPRACRLRLGDRDRATAQDRLSEEVRAADAPNHTENPRWDYAAPGPGDRRC